MNEQLPAFSVSVNTKYIYSLENDSRHSGNAKLHLNPVYEIVQHTESQTA